jgi:hypothetical protein
MSLRLVALLAGLKEDDDEGLGVEDESDSMIMPITEVLFMLLEVLFMLLEVLFMLLEVVFLIENGRVAARNLEGQHSGSSAMSRPLTIRARESKRAARVPPSSSVGFAIIPFSSLALMLAAELGIAFSSIAGGISEFCAAFQ